MQQWATASTSGWGRPAYQGTRESEMQSVVLCDQSINLPLTSNLFPGHKVYHYGFFPFLPCSSTQGDLCPLPWLDLDIQVNNLVPGIKPIFFKYWLNI